MGILTETVSTLCRELVLKLLVIREIIRAVIPAAVISKLVMGLSDSVGSITTIADQTNLKRRLNSCVQEMLGRCQLAKEWSYVLKKLKSYKAQK